MFLLYIVYCGLDANKTYFLANNLIKDTVLGLTLWGANTFPRRNRLLNPYLVCKYFIFWFFYSFFIIYYGGDSNLYPI